jgi:hypothetical protein
MITVATEEDTYSIDGDLSMTLENLMAILEADVSMNKQWRGDEYRSLSPFPFPSLAFQQMYSLSTATTSRFRVQHRHSPAWE